MGWDDLTEAMGRRSPPHPRSDIDKDISELADEVCVAQDKLRDSTASLRVLKVRLLKLMKERGVTSITRSDRPPLKIQTSYVRDTSKKSLVAHIGETVNDVWDNLPMKSRDSLTIPKKSVIEYEEGDDIPYEQ